MQSFLAGLKQVDVKTFSSNRVIYQPGCYVLNEQNKLTHLSVLADSSVDFRDIVKHPTLIELYFQSNQLSKLPKSIRSLQQLAFLDLSQNPIVDHLAEYIDDIHTKIDAQTLIKYLLSIQHETTTPLNEAKVLFLGDERVGKTSLINRITGRPYNPNQPTTHTIELCKHQLPNGIQANIWDFAGQDITQDIHQFFLSSRSLYVYVLDSSKEDISAAVYYWLSMIQINGENPPVILVVNKRDLNTDYNFDINDYNEFNIVDVLYLSAENEENLSADTRKNIDNSVDDLLNSINTQVSALSHIKFPLPTNWRKVKNTLESMADEDIDFIESHNYEVLCEQQGIENEYLQKTLLTLFNQIGTVVTFKNHHRLSTMQVINPQWVIDGIYKIIRSPLIDAHTAQLKQQDFIKIFEDDKKYKTRHYHWLADLINQFELSFNLDDSTLFIPAKLSPKAPEFDLSHYQQGLNFRFQYDGILKKSVLARFIVQMKDYIATMPVPYWQRGVFLQVGNFQAVVISDEQQKTITIAIDTNNRMTRQWLTTIRQKLNKINAGQFQATEEVPLIKDGQVVGYESYPFLVECEKDEQRHIRLKTGIAGEGSHRFLVSDLLYDYHLDGITSKYNFNVRKFQGIEHIQLDLPFSAPWIFLTGNNGYGKTNILQAIARGLSGVDDGRVYDGIKPLAQASISITINGNTAEVSSDAAGVTSPSCLVLAYGASRLDMGSESSNKNFRPCSSLFESQVMLRNIEKEGLSQWYFERDEHDEFEKCLHKFIQLMPNLKGIKVEKVNKGRQVWYTEQDDSGQALPPVQFRDLATGNQSIIAMVGDIILNLATQQQTYQNKDPNKHKRAVVLIDELELYLHPIWQKRLPALLTQLFPDVLFIASTHSPMPLLGAPEHSAFFTVNRSVEAGITLTRFDNKIDIEELLPNTMLSSPIFGMEDIFASSFSGNKPVRTEDSYSEVQLNKAIEQKIEDFANNTEQKERIDRYMQKAKQENKP